MLFALLGTFISSFTRIFYKKSLSFGVNERIYEFLSYPIGILIFVYFLITGVSPFEIPLLAWLGGGFIILMYNINQPVIQSINKEEKISVLLPYQNINKVLVIIAGFIFFRDVSLTTFLITILAIFVIIAFSIDYKTFKFPRNIKKILYIEAFTAFDILLGGYLVLTYGDIEYFSINVVFGILIATLFLFVADQHRYVFTYPKKFYITRFLSALGWISWLLSLVVVSNLGVSMGILLGFVSIGIILIFGYFFLGDTPSKKNIAITLIVSALIGIGYYFK